MIFINDEIVNIGHFPDGTQLIKKEVKYDFVDYREATIEWRYEKDEELVTLIYLVNHLKSHGIGGIHLNMPYIPNARQDRVKGEEDVFTLKAFAKIINDLKFESVKVLDPHSNVSESLIDKIYVQSPKSYIHNAIGKIGSDNLTIFYPDEGACKRYSGMFSFNPLFGIKKRDWKTGNILSFTVNGDEKAIKGKDILIVDDICSRGGTFYHAALHLKELGANKIYLYVTHCENTVLEGDMIYSGVIERVFTTDSIFTGKHEKIEVIDLL